MIDTPILPDGSIIRFERYSTKEQRTLYKKFQRGDATAADDLLAACVKVVVTREGEEKPLKNGNIAPILDLHSASRRAALVCIRREMHGPEVQFGWRCQGRACKRENGGFRVSIDDFEGFGAKDEAGSVKPMPPAHMETQPTGPDGAVLPLPRSKRSVSWDLPTGRSERRLVDLAKKYDPEDPMLLLLARNVKVEDQVLSSEALDRIDPVDSEWLLPFLTKIGGPDTSVTAECNGCGAVFKRHLEGLPDFFFLAVSRMNQ